MKNFSNSIFRKSKIKYLKRRTERRISSNKSFGFLFLTNKGCMRNDFVTIRNGDTFIDKESESMEMFNTHCININPFSKIYEKYILSLITPFVNNFLSIFISACRKSYNSNHLLIRPIENWKQS